MPIRLTDLSVLEICRTLTQLKKLKIRRCRAITDIGIKEIRLLKHLECLDISECDAITSKGLIEGIANQPNDRMIELHVSALNICELAVIKIAENLPNLRLLDLSFCRTAVTDLATQIIFKNLILLRSLNLEFCDMVSFCDEHCPSRLCINTMIKIFVLNSVRYPTLVLQAWKCNCK